MNRRAQFFLFAAVIIAVLVAGFGVVVNRARSPSVDDTTGSVATLVSRETGKVIDYEVYAASSGSVSSFVDSLAYDIREKDSSANFLFVIGDRDEFEVRNYGEEYVTACTAGDECQKVRAGNLLISGSVKGGSGSLPLNARFQDYDVDGDFWTKKFTGADEVSLVVRGQEFDFPLTDAKRVIFVIVKEVGGESYVAVE